MLIRTTGGNTVFLHLFLDAFLLQPCNPTCTLPCPALPQSARGATPHADIHSFLTVLTARDAIIQADANRFNGVNRCTLWTAFASRGLGVNAANHNDDSTVPAGC